MTFTTTLVFALTLTAAAVRAQNIGACGEKTVTPVSNFNYEDFVKQDWDFAYVPDDPFFYNFEKASLSLDKPDPTDCAYRAVVSVTSNDGSQSQLLFHDKYVGKGTVYESVLDVNGYPTGNRNKIIFYGFKKNSWAQFYLCTLGGNTDVPTDFRYTVVTPGYTLTEFDKVDIEANDLIEGFRGDVIKIGRQYK